MDSWAYRDSGLGHPLRHGCSNQRAELDVLLAKPSLPRDSSLGPVTNEALSRAAQDPASLNEAQAQAARVPSFAAPKRLRDRLSIAPSGISLKQVLLRGSKFWKNVMREAVQGEAAEQETGPKPEPKPPNPEPGVLNYPAMGASSLLSRREKPMV